MTFRTSFCPCVLFMSENCNVIADGLEDKKQSKDCFYVTEWGCVVYDWTEIDRKMYTALDRVSCIFGSGNATYGIIKEDVPTWCKQLYYDFFLIYGLYMFPTFTWPSSGVLIYRLFHCRMWCYAIGVEAVVLRSWCVVSCYLSLRYLCTCSTSDRCSWLNPRNVFPKYGYSSRNILFIRRKKKPSITNKCWKFYWRSKIRCGCTACTYMHIHLQNTTA